MEAFERLEQEYKEFMALDSWHPVAVSSGTSALHLALEAMKLESGSKVLVPDFSMVAIPRAVVMAGLEPVFGDIDSRLNLNFDGIEYKLGKLELESIRAVIIVHTYGRKVWAFDSLVKLAERYKWHIVEDLAEAHGIVPNPNTYAACWSFYKNKIIAGEEGGMVAFRDDEIANHVRRLRSLGFTDSHDFWHIPRGVNARMSNLHAEAVLSGVRAYSNNVAKRRHLEAAYNGWIPDKYQQPLRQTPWVYDVRIKDCTAERLDRIVFTLRQQGIAARHGFKSNSLQGEFWRAGGLRLPQPESLKASNEVMYLPLNPDLHERTAVDAAQRLVKLINETESPAYNSPKPIRPGQG